MSEGKVSFGGTLKIKVHRAQPWWRRWSDVVIRGMLIRLGMIMWWINGNMFVYQSHDGRWHLTWELPYAPQEYYEVRPGFVTVHHYKENEEG